MQLGYPIWKFDIRTAFLLALADGKYYCFYPALFRLAEMTEEELLECRRIVLHGTDEEQRKLKRELCVNVDGQWGGVLVGRRKRKGSR